jgi:hypothetical protein
MLVSNGQTIILEQNSELNFILISEKKIARTNLILEENKNNF